jgi:transketolase
MSYQIEILLKISKNIRKKIIKMVSTSKSSHVGSALSIVEILVVLYFKVLKIDSQNPEYDNRDRFILSKGHASAALYAALSERGFFAENLLDKFFVDGGILPGHLDRNVKMGIEVSSGSLGHGLSIGVGMAIAAKHDNKNHKTYVLMSDGECDEGSVWEAAMLAGHLKLDNLVAIIDYNKIQSFGRVEEVLNLEPLYEKWVAFGWGVKEVNGHDFQELLSALESIPIKPNKPSIVIANTIKGKGVSFMENKLEWHYKSPDQQQYEMAIKEIDAS